MKRLSGTRTVLCRLIHFLKGCLSTDKSVSKAICVPAKELWNGSRPAFYLPVGNE